MPTWTAFAVDQPDLAGRVRAILTATTNAVLGTIRADGSPRLSGIDPFFVEDDLWLGSMRGARKGADIARDPRIALHSVPWESRPAPVEGHDVPASDVKISALAVRITDADRQRQIMAAFAADRGMDAPGDADGVHDDADLFSVDLQSVVVTGVADDLLVIERWTPNGGITVTRRS